MDDLSGKTILITGGTSGIGKAAAVELARMGAQVVIAGRSPQKTEAVAQEIRAASAGQAVGYLIADFQDLAQVRRMAAEFKQTYPRLDVLVNNAGAFFIRRSVNSAGVESTFLVNHLASFVLTNALLDVLVSSSPARVVTVSSGAHKQATLDFEDLSFERSYSGMQAYARSKLVNILFTYELARRLEGTGVTANALNPGFVATDIWRAGVPLIGTVFKRLIGLRGLSPEQGADTIVYLAASPEVQALTGTYFKLRQAIPSSPLSYDPAAAKSLWEISERLAGRL